jgi:hypothetical protein
MAPPLDTLDRAVPSLQPEGTRAATLEAPSEAPRSPRPSVPPRVRPTPPMRFHVDGWDPGYGSSADLEDELGDSTAEVTVDVEIDEARWAPIPATVLPAPAAVLFVDGVRRIEARLWIDDRPDPAAAHAAGATAAVATDASAAICASYAAGVMCCCDHRAHLLTIESRRGLFTVAPHAVDVATTAGVYQACHTAGDDQTPLSVTLSAALQRRLAQVELITAVAARAALAEHLADDHAGRSATGTDGAEDLLVIDGPLRGRQHLDRTVGFIKTHQRRYLPPTLHALVSTLRAGDRTPVFLMGTTWDRHSWYLRLPGTAGGPWSGIVRLECSADLSRDAVLALANLSQSVLCRYASTEYKDARAPQNLYPIGGLERELRRRLGDPRILYRALRRAAA